MNRRSVIPTATAPFRRRSGGFTLVEMLVSMGVLALLLVLITLLFHSTTMVIGMGHKRMDADMQTRAVYDRMAVDFAQMINRTDVDYYLKDPATPQPGNDQLAFFSQVPGYYPATMSGTAQQSLRSPLSLVAYRLNSDSSGPFYNKLQRFGYGLVWNGVVSGSSLSAVFSGSSTTSLPNTISTKWPNATTMTADANYELVGPQVFRMEYFYVLKGQTSAAGTAFSSQLSDTPWETRPDTQNADPNLQDQPWHSSVNGLQDVAAIAVVLAVIDEKSRVLVSDAQLRDLAAAMQDFSPTDMPNPGDLQAQWQSVIDSSTNGIPRVAASNLRVYSRTFYLSSNSP